MASKSASWRLLNTIGQTSKTRPASSTLTLRCLQSRPHIAKRTIPACRYLSYTPSPRQKSNNTAPLPPSQSQTNSSTSHRKYTFSEIQSITKTPGPNRILIDVREPSELQDSGKIPTSLNLPLKTSPDFMFMAADEFEDRFGRPRPGPNDEVIFYCRSGVRSKAAAELAKQTGFGGTVSEFPGSWIEWEKNGGTVER